MEDITMHNHAATQLSKIIMKYVHQGTPDELFNFLLNYHDAKSLMKFLSETTDFFEKVFIVYADLRAKELHTQLEQVAECLEILCLYGIFIPANDVYFTQFQDEINRRYPEIAWYFMNSFLQRFTHKDALYARIGNFSSSTLLEQYLRVMSSNKIFQVNWKKDLKITVLLSIFKKYLAERESLVKRGKLYQTTLTEIDDANSVFKMNGLGVVGTGYGFMSECNCCPTYSREGRKKIEDKIIVSANASSYDISVLKPNNLIICSNRSSIEPPTIVYLTSRSINVFSSNSSDSDLNRSETGRCPSSAKENSIGKWIKWL